MKRIIGVLAILAWFNALYLTWSFYNYKAPQPATNQFSCDVSEKFSCSTVLKSPVVEIVPNVPFPLIAALVYPVIFILAFVSARKNKNYYPALAAISAGGIAFNSVFIYRESTIGVYCPLCLLCTIIISTIFILSLIGMNQEKRRLQKTS